MRSDSRTEMLGEAVLPYGRRTVVEPAKGWHMLDLRELWSYRDLLAVFVQRDIKVRYKQTVLGAAWVILRPLLSVAIFTVIFGRLVRVPSEGYPYAVFVYAALLPWTFFAGAVSSSGNSMVGSAGLIGKVYFPRLIVPFSSVGAGIVDFAVSATFLLVIMPVFGTGWSINLLAAPLLLVPVLILALGFGTLFSALAVAYRDFVGIMGFVLQVWMYATPVIYASSLVPERWRFLLHMNPMTGLVEGFRSAFLGRPFDLVSIAISSSVAVVVFLVGIAYFTKVERRFADII
ncbi:MAG: ABC transporter permease [Deltaproteobacteria bacterium]|nr:ABC transporter permease [Deltaproteobacteria bacterium]MDH3382458.1 ABC transporter permease [Deltaproteobacteria bacterium]